MDVYQPAEDSYLLQKWVRRYVFGRVLDMGTGSGIQALTAVENPNVKEIIAVDINENAVHYVQEQVTTQKLRKVKALHGDLWEPVHGSFHTIIFNPPYLPQDKDVEDKSIYGGKKGWEVIATFFSRAAEHLFHDGVMLLLFSSLTHKEKVEEIIVHHLFEFKELERQKLAFEELYVYLITKSELLRELQNKGIHDIQYVAHGQRGEVFQGMM
ncbi:MAG: HemK2/MTQ2 family protein methyltransferase, partial [Nanoarchaeota archaeon]